MTAGTLGNLHVRGTALAGLVLVLVTGCAGVAQRHHEQKIPQLGVIEPNQARELEMTSMPDYIVEPPDQLEVSVRPNYPDLALTTVPVQIDGKIDLGFVGDIYVTGLTLQEVELKISQRLNLLANPKSLPRGGYVTSVRLSNGNPSKSYYVLGTVKNEGKFPCTGHDTVLDAILLAGLRSHSLPAKAYLSRPHPAGGPDQIMAIDWCGIRDRGDTLTNYQVFPGDRIIVPGGKPPGLLSTLVGGG